MGLERLEVEIGADARGFHKELKGVRGGITKLKGGLSSLVKGGLAMAGITAGLVGIGKTMQAYAGLRNSVQRTNELFNDSNKYIKYFAENNARGFGMAETTAYQYAMTYGNLFKGITRDTTENAKVTIAMMKASAVIASKTGRTMEDVNERIRSGILGNTEAIEDLGINVPIAMIKTTKAFKDVAKGAKWENLTYQQQQQIRVLAILEQATNQYGTTVSQISGWSLPRLGQAFKDLVSYAGMFVTAGLQPVINALGQLVVWATAGLKALSKLFGMKVEGNLATPLSGAGAGLSAGATGAEDMAGGLGDAAKNAKKLKSQTAGFDVFNDITATAAASGGTGTGGGAVGGSPFDGLPKLEGEEENPFESFESTPLSEFVSRLYGAMRTFKKTNFFQGISESFQTMVQTISPQILKFKETFSGMWADIKALAAPFAEWFNGDFTAYFQETINLWGTVISGLLDTFNTVFSDIWNIAIYPMLEKWTTKLLPMWTQISTEIVKTVGILFTEVKKIFDMLWQQGIKPAMELGMKIWTEFADLLVEKWNTYGSPIFEGIREAFRVTGELLKTVWDTVLKPVWDTFMETVDWLWEKHLKPLVSNIGDFVGELITAALHIYNGFIAPLVSWFVEKLGPPIAGVMQFIISVVGTVIGAAADIISGLITTLKGVLQFINGVFTGDWGKAWEGIKNIFGGTWESIAGAFKGTLNLIIDGINAMIRGLNRFKFDVPDWVPGGAGGKTFGINIPEIPKLAKGGMAFGEVHALVGDNFNARQNPEVIAPLSDLKGMILEALMQKEIATGGRGDLVIPIYLDGREIAKGIRVPLNDVAKIEGFQPVFRPAT